ncbi:MAG: WD40 repeat domain-containing protein [Planctomycetia bacterium]|nr:WD40 repeat domain-containing protein [Planctomycetia bacterium]
MQVFQTSSVWRNQMAFAPDGRFLAVAAQSITLLDTTDGTTRELTAGGSTGLLTWLFAFVRGGSAIAYYLDDTLAVRDLATGSELRETFSDASISGLVTDPRTDTLYVTFQSFANGRAEFRAFDPTTLKQRAVFGGSNQLCYSTVISADGQRLACMTIGGLRVWRVPEAGQQSRPSRRIGMPHPTAFAISLDGSRLVTTSSSRGVTMWNSSSGKEVWRSGKHRRGVHASAWCPTRPIFATGDSGGGVFFWDEDGHVLKRYDWKLDAVYALAFAPDGLRCAAADIRGKVVVWDVDV